MMIVKKVPVIKFNILLNLGFNKTDKKVIEAGIANKIAASSNFNGLSNKLFPFIKPFAF